MTELEPKTQVKKASFRKNKGAKGASNDEKQELKAVFRNHIRDWFLGRYGLSNLDYPRPWVASMCVDSLNFYRRKDDDSLESLSSDKILYELIHASIDEAQLWAPDFSWSTRQAADCLAQIESQLVMGEAQDLFVDESKIKPIRFADDPGFCFHRLPFPKKIAEDFNGFDLRQARMGRFMTNMIEVCPDYDPETGESLSFQRFLVWLGIVLTGDDSPKEMLVLVSGGNDGKTTLLEAIQDNLGGESVVKLGQDIEQICDKHQKVQILNKRVFHFEEPKSGHLFTAALKRVVGSQVLEGRFLYKNSMNFSNRACFIVSTNNAPKIDGSRAHKSRLRMMTLGEVQNHQKMSGEEAKQDLAEHWERICQCALAAAVVCGFKIPENTDDELDESTSSFFAKSDAIIDDCLCVEPGAFMPISLVTALCERQRVSTDDMRKRLPMRFPELRWVKARVPREGVSARRIAPVWGFENLGFLPESWAWRNENYHKKYRKSGQKMV